jgi:SPP1 family predicted phage head-tail adaptor
MPINAGLLNQRILLQRPGAGIDARGQAEDAWVDVATVWARVEPMRGREYFAAAQMQATADVRITIRHRSDIDATWRALHRGVAHALVSPPIDPHARRETLELMCTTGARDGR